MDELITHFFNSSWKLVGHCGVSDQKLYNPITLVIKSDNIVVSIKEDNFERFNYYILKFVREQKVFHTSVFHAF